MGKRYRRAFEEVGAWVPRACRAPGLFLVNTVAQIIFTVQDNPYQAPQTPHVPSRRWSPTLAYGVAALLTIALCSLAFLQHSERFRWTIEKVFYVDLWEGDRWDG